MTGFVNSLGLRMIAVPGGRFDAWTPSMARYGAQVSAGERPEAAFGQNRPHVGIPVEVAPFHLSQFPVTNALYRRFVEETGHRQPRGELITFHWEPIAETAPWEHPGLRRRRSAGHGSAGRGCPRVLHMALRTGGP